MRLHVLSLLYILAGIQIYAQNPISLNGTWSFALAKTAQEAELLEEFHTPDFNSSSFKQIPVPSNWAVLGFEEPVYRGFEEDKASEGFYLHEFTTPSNWNDKRILLHFGGVWSSAEVWLNNHYLGRHDSGYTSFAFDVTGKLNSDKNNKLAVRVRQVSREYKFDVFDDWTLGGIYREVTMEAMPGKRWLDQVVVQTTFDSNYNDADLKIRTMVSDRNNTTLPGNYPSPGEPYDLKYTLLNKEREEVMHRQITIPAHTATDREIPLTFRIEKPFHWTAETPYLYTLNIDLIENNIVTHRRTERIGFREISTDGGVFRINGQIVKLRGVNRHDEHPDVGRATTHEHWLQDIKLMKSANINYIRTSHYTPDKGFIELCDELGMYVGNEVSLGGAGQRMIDPSYSGAVLVRSYETVVRDINSPSIIYWSIGNEDPLTSLHLASIKLVKALDSTRPVMIPWRSESWLPEEIDLLSSHYWHPHEYDQLAAQADRPIITTEYTHAYGVNGFGGLDARWKALTKHTAGAGGAIWMWADQGIKTPVKNPKGLNEMNPNNEYMRIDGAGWDGIVDSYRNPTRDYFETKAVYSPVYLKTDKVTFTPGQSYVYISIKNEFDFTDLNRIKISWNIFEDENVLDSGYGSIDGIPHTTAMFKLPIEKLNIIQAEKTYYAWFIFTGIDGEEITRRAVELEPVITPTRLLTNTENLLVTQNNFLKIGVGDVEYIFNPQTGHLISADLKGQQMITDLRPIIWRKPDHSETSVIGRHNVRATPDLNKYNTSVTSWVIEENEESVGVLTKVKYDVDKNNSFTVHYQYKVGKDKHLYIRYEIYPEITVENVPIVGMTLQTVPELNQLRWLGLGPYDAYPNKQAAPILGVWEKSADSDEVTGNKATQWIERSGSIGTLKINNKGYLEYRENTPDVIHILSGVLARTEKGRKADGYNPQLETNTGNPFIGEFSINLR